MILVHQTLSSTSQKTTEHISRNNFTKLYSCKLLNIMIPLTLPLSGLQHRLVCDPAVKYADYSRVLVVFQCVTLIKVFATWISRNCYYSNKKYKDNVIMQTAANWTDDHCKTTSSDPVLDVNHWHKPISLNKLDVSRWPMTWNNC